MPNQTSIIYPIIDTHAHIDFETLELSVDEILSKCAENGVEKIIIPGVEEKDLHRIITLIDKYDMLYGAVAIHPSEAKDWNADSYQNLKELASHKKIVAIGECGLDYHWDKTFNDVQIEVFKEHIRLAKELNKPLIIHDREAHGDTLAVLKETNAKEVGGVMHCFSGSVEFAHECIKEGLYIALGGVVTFKNAKVPKQVAKEIPLDKLLIETDSPFLTPHPFRGKENNPSLVKLVAEEIAKIREIPYEEVAKATSENAVRLFGF